MSTYHYSQCKVVDEITFRKTANGAMRAYLHACPEIGQGKVEDVLKALKAQDFECIPFTVNDKPVVEVRGFKRDAQLLKVLSDGNFIEGAPTVTKDADDKVSWGEMISKRSIQAGGLSMCVADLGYINYGAKGKRWEDAVAGIGYLSGSAVFASLGRNDQSKFQIREGAQLILEHARQKGYDIPEDTALSTVGAARKESSLRKVLNFFEKHPTEIGNMLIVSAGALIAKSALQHRALATPRPDMTAKQISEMRKGGWLDVGLGTCTITSGLTATLVKEKARDPDAPRKQGLAGAAEWVQEKPLRAASIGYIGSTLFHAFTTFVERREAIRIINDVGAKASEVALAVEARKAIKGRVLFVAASLVGETLLSISSKGHGEGVVSDNTVDDSIVAVAAELIIKQPKHLQEGLIQEMGKFLGQPDVLALKDEEAVIRLRTQVEEMRCNPWATKDPVTSKAALQEKMVASPAQEGVPAPHFGAKGLMPAWQAKVASNEANAGIAQMPLG